MSKAVPLLGGKVPGRVGDVNESGNGTGNRSSGLGGCSGGAVPPASIRENFPR